MRTTLSLPHDLFAALQELARKEESSFEATVVKVLRSGLASRGRSKQARPYRLESVSMGPLARGVDLTKALRLAFDPPLERTAESQGA